MAIIEINFIGYKISQGLYVSNNANVVHNVNVINPYVLATKKSVNVMFKRYVLQLRVYIHSDADTIWFSTDMDVNLYNGLCLLQTNAVHACFLSNYQHH